MTLGPEHTTDPHNWQELFPTGGHSRLLHLEEKPSYIICDSDWMSKTNQHPPGSSLASSAQGPGQPIEEFLSDVEQVLGRQET